MATKTLSFFESLRPIAGPVLRSTVNAWLGGERAGAANAGKLATTPHDVPVIVLPKRGQARIGCFGRFVVPEDFDDDPKVVLLWTTDTAADDLQARLEVDYLAVAVGDSIDQAPAESVGVNAEGGDGPFVLAAAEFELDDDDAILAAGALVTIGIYRDHLQAADDDDTVPGPVYVYDALFTYDDGVE